MNSMHMYANVDQDSFFPKSFDCNEASEFESFCIYFKLLQAECILKNYLHLALENQRDTEEYKLLDKEDALEVRVALRVCRRRMITLGELIESKNDWVEVTEKEW